MKLDDAPRRLDYFDGNNWFVLYLQTGQSPHRNWANKAVYRLSAKEGELWQRNGRVLPVVLLKIE